MILRKGLYSVNCCQKKNFKVGLAHVFFGKGELVDAYKHHLNYLIGYFPDPVKIG